MVSGTLEDGGYNAAMAIAGRGGKGHEKWLGCCNSAPALIIVFPGVGEEEATGASNNVKRPVVGMLSPAGGKR